MKERTICAVWVVLGGVVGEGGFGLKIWVGGLLWAERRCGGGSGIRGTLVSGILRLVSLSTCDYG